MEQISSTLFFSTFALIFLAELPDKTAVTTVILATGEHPFAVFLGVAAAFVTQSLAAVCFGGLLSLLPEGVVKGAAGILFLVFAWSMWRKNEIEVEDKDAKKAKKATFKATLWSSFLVIFIAEWGDLTQLATAALVAKHKAPLTIFLSATLALWAVTAIAVLMGHRMKKFINPILLQKTAAVVFFAAGVVMLVKIS